MALTKEQIQAREEKQKLDQTIGKLSSTQARIALWAMARGEELRAAIRTALAYPCGD